MKLFLKSIITFLICLFLISSVNATTCISNTSYFGSYTIVNFTVPSVCEWIVPFNVSTVDVLVVAGGGGAGSTGGGGGGAGGVLFNYSYPVSGTINVVVGGGGAGGSYDTGANGGFSLFNTLNATGGGGGGGGVTKYGINGGSGGGSRYNSYIVGNGVSGQGKDGGYFVNGGGYGAGGGGGYNNSGLNATIIPNKNGAGGDGLFSSISCYNKSYGGGGAGGGGGGCANGGLGGGGNGKCSTGTGTGYNGQINTGGGGGGGENNGNGGDGGSGIIMVRYGTPPPPSPSVPPWHVMGCGNLSFSTVNIKDTSIMWSWAYPLNITNVSLDGISVNNYDYSNMFIASDLKPKSTHFLRIANFNDSACSIQETTNLNITENEKFYGSLNTWFLLLLTFVCLIIGIRIPLVGLIGFFFSLYGAITAFITGGFLFIFIYLCLLISCLYVFEKGVHG